MGQVHRTIGVMLAAVLPACPPLAHAADGPAPSHLALVIGNGGYAGLPGVPACVASAHMVTAALQRAGYAVTEQVDESNGRMGAALSDFADALEATPDPTAVLYACGHAVGYDGRVFFMPVSATLERTTDALTQGLLGGLLVGTISQSKVKAGLVVLDAVAVPGGDPIPFAALADEKATGPTGFVAATSAAQPPQGRTTLANALSAAFAQPNVEVKATVQALRSAYAGSAAASLVTFEPPQPAYLSGGPPPAAPPVADAAPVSTAPAVLNPAERRRLQLSLQRLGYFHGRVNGTVGADTVGAIRRYQTETGAAPTGQLTADQLGHLLEDGR